MKPLRIAIASSGRFHVLDLARELASRGHDVRFYSYLPRFRTRQFRLPVESHVDLFRWAWPLAAWEHRIQTWRRLRGPIVHELLDALVTRALEPCDVFIFMSGMYVRAPLAARSQFGAKLILHRGSQHVLEQMKLLRESGAEMPTRSLVIRELRGYSIADRIAVPSKHVAMSFKRHGVGEKLWQNPYGVDLTSFQPAPKSGQGTEVRFVFVGSWSYQKGCDLLVKCLDHVRGLFLQHVGPSGDCPFPLRHPKFAHHPPVDQRELSRFYQASDASVLASRQDGFGMVLAQALACGLPILCTTNTGGPGLAHTRALKEQIYVVEPNNVEALICGFRRLIDDLTERRIGQVSDADRETLSWTGYAARYEANLSTLFP